MNAPAIIENRLFDEIVLGDSDSMTRTVTHQDIALFALVSGDVNPAHMDPDYAATDMFHRVIVHGMWGAGLISAVLGTRLPGPGTIYLGQTLLFRKPVGLGDTITARVTVTERREDKKRLKLACNCTNQNGEEVIVGEADVIAPTERVSRPRMALPDIRLAEHDAYRKLMLKSQGAAMPTAVVHPCSASALAAALDAADAGLITPILVGPEAKLHALAQQAGLSIKGIRLVPAAHSHEAAALAVELVHKGEAALLMKGSLHTDELMRAVLASDTAANPGLRTARRVSHAYVMDVPGHPRPLIITDAAINVTPSLEDKADIIRNAVDLAHMLGIAEPKVAILAAVEVVNPSMRATLDAAALCKMADRGQITGGVLDGPLAFDNAISPAAAQEKGITSPVAGQADILVVPDLEAGNMLAKQLTFLGQADAAGVVLGAKVPVILTSRADSLRTRLASCAVAVLMARRAAA